MRTSQWSAWRPLVAALLGSVAVAAAAQSWTFDGGAEGWQAIEVSGSSGNNWSTVIRSWTPTYDTSGKFISTLDNSSQTAFAFERTVAGGYETYLDGSLNFSLQSSASNWTGDRTLALVGNNTTVIANLGKNPGSTWTPFSVGLSATNFTHDTPSGGGAVGVDEFTLVLRNLSSIRISAEFGMSPPLETTGLDSVRFTAVPEPSTYAAMLGGAALALVAVRRFRRR